MQPVANVKQAASLLVQPLQVPQRANVGDENGADGHRRFLDAAIHEVRRVRAVQELAQVGQTDGHQLFQQFADASVFFTSYATRGGHKQRSGRQYPERAAAAAAVGQERGREVFKVANRLILFPKIPGGAARVKRVQDDVL